MDLSPEQIATAISRHVFADAYPHLADDVRWNVVGGDLLEGKESVIEGCEQSANYLAGLTTTFDTFKVKVFDTSVVIESSASYVDDEGESSVASCDIYDFVLGKLTEITSYNIELPKTE